MTAADPRSGLFSPLALREIELKNRIVISPMWQYFGRAGHSVDWHMMHYGRFAEGGAGLVMQEGTTVEQRGRGTSGDLGIWDDAFVPGLARIVQIVRDGGAVPGIQLMHAGAKAGENLPWDTATRGGTDVTDSADGRWERIGPSAVSAPSSPHGEPPREMTVEDIRQVTQAWIRAAARAARAGYDVLELHAAHGYLIHSFLSDITNRRTDRYGGPFAKRIRFLCEIVEGIREVWPAHKPLLVRLSCVDGTSWTLDDTIALARVLKRLGVDMIDCSSGGIDRRMTLGRRRSYAYQADLAATVRREAGILTNAVGLIVHAHHAEEILERGMADTIAIAREALYNPNWPIDAAHKLGIDPTFRRLPDRQRFWLHYRSDGMEGFMPSTHDAASVPGLPSTRLNRGRH